MSDFDVKSSEIIVVPGDREHGIIELRGIFTSPFLIHSWRTERFVDAVGLALEEAGVTELDQGEALDLETGCARAANRACSFERDEGVIKFSEPVQKVVRLLGSEKFKAIYNASLPAELVDYAISDENKRRLAEHYCEPALEEVAVEVLRGRLAWEDRFAEAGVPEPSEYAQTAPSQLREDGSPLWGSY